MDPVVRLLEDLVSIDSVNPSLVAGGAGEGQIAGVIAAWLRQAGFDVALRDVAAGRPNVVAVADGAGSGPTRLLCGHTDTVGVEGMSAPFAPVVRDGLLYGRGAQDMKSGVAAMMSAARTWMESGRRGAGKVIVAAVADEEYASLGADALVREWRADEAVIPEPTDLQIGIAHKGFSCAEVVVHGRAAHGSRPAEGRDAIFLMGRLIARLDALDRTLQSSAPHPLLGSPSLHAGTIAGGTSLSVYPAECVLKVERRTLPAEPVTTAVDEVERIVAELTADDPAFRCDVRLVLARPGYELDREADVLRHLEAAATARLGVRPRAGLSYWTDAAILGAAGTPTAIFGPRGHGLHSIEEAVVLEDVVGCRDVLASWLAS